MTNIDGNPSESTINDDRETSSSESININPFENDVAPNFIYNLGQTVIENFKKCTEEIIIDNSEIMNVINQAIGEQREIFREFIEASIKSSNHLADFSIDALFFVECFRNRQFSDGEILDLLKDLLEKSERNYKSAKELKNIISRGTMREDISEPNMRLDTILEDETIGMKEKLIKIHNFLNEYVDDINKSPHKIDSVKNSILRRVPNGILQIFKDHPYLGASGALAVLAGSALVDIVVLGVSLSVSLTGSVGILCNDMVMKNERDKLVEKIIHVRDGLKSIVVEIGRIEVFWSDQTEKIKYLINNLARFNNENGRIKRYQIANQIEKRWKDVEDDCKNYSRLMKDVLNKDRLISDN